MTSFFVLGGDLDRSKLSLLFRLFFPKDLERERLSCTLRFGEGLNRPFRRSGLRSLGPLRGEKRELILALGAGGLRLRLWLRLRLLLSLRPRFLRRRAGEVDREREREE